MKRDVPRDYDDSVQKDGNCVHRDALIHREFQTEAEFRSSSVCRGLILLLTQSKVAMLLRLNLLFSCQSSKGMHRLIGQLLEIINERTNSPQGHPEKGGRNKGSKGKKERTGARTQNR